MTYYLAYLAFGLLLMALGTRVLHRAPHEWQITWAPYAGVGGLCITVWSLWHLFR
jgi:hypothetical protein